jgi:hypothetical protein
MKTNEEIELIEVFTGIAWQAAMVKNLLENAGITVFLKDEILGTLGPWWTASGGPGSVKVVVSSLDFEVARIIVEEYEQNSKMDNVADDTDEKE